MPITITRGERDVLHAELQFNLASLDTVGLRADLTTPEAARLAQAQARKLQRTFAMLDTLGWSSDDDREEFEVPITDLAVEWLKTRDVEIHRYLVDLDNEYHEQEAGNEDYFIDGCSRDDSMAITRAKVGQEECTARLVDRLLQRMFDPEYEAVA